MYVVNARNVAEALPVGLSLLQRYGVREESRNGPVIVMPAPVTTIYTRPQERVLTSAVRDANPAFHLVESLWMLAGRNDAGLLNNFVRDFGDRFAEPGGIIHGAYGHRWRAALGFDQLDHCVEVLKRDSSSRQCVIQMWDASWQDRTVYTNPPGPDTDEIGSDDLRGQWRDRPCNTHVYLRVRGDRGMTDHGNGNVSDYDHRVLDITVCCRSNDIVWGAYGANAVHFSVLQEYLAARIGVEVGTYYQVSNNYHAYTRELERLQKRSPLIVATPLVPSYKDAPNTPSEVLQADLPTALADERYADGRVYALPMVTDPESFDAELLAMLEAYENYPDALPDPVRRDLPSLRNPWLAIVAMNVMLAHRAYKQGNQLMTRRYLEDIPEGCDWRVAMTEWIQRRVKL